VQGPASDRSIGGDARPWQGARRAEEPFNCAVWNGAAGSLAFPLHGLDQAIPFSSAQDKANVVRLQD
jgi:hypothetical protein